LQEVVVGIQKKLILNFNQTREKWRRVMEGRGTGAAGVA
jgi:hypothetical protein